MSANELLGSEDLTFVPEWNDLYKLDYRLALTEDGFRALMDKIDYLQAEVNLWENKAINYRDSADHYREALEKVPDYCLETSETLVEIEERTPWYVWFGGGMAIVLTFLGGFFIAKEVYQ